ncbi:Uncharacterized protein TCAP_01244 [Tolypocladium capitatum]|uniref:Uncharacterized protein n=1 Tax=Tolypocladium capitatum TaxID=45235 RepID=A0A2K3QMS8_9HYPO|nr:Uncharacterized protein TCAP_01244 [Tolypocladium capitatum]
MPAGDKKWDMAAERDLSVAIILANNEGKPSYNWPRVYSIMESIGYRFTKDAISQHFTKVVMKDFKARNGDVTKKGSPAASTPKKGNNTPTKRKVTPGKSTKFVHLDEGEDDEDDLVGPTPKKAKADSEDESPFVKKEKVYSRARSPHLARLSAMTRPSFRSGLPTEAGFEHPLGGDAAQLRRRPVATQLCRECGFGFMLGQQPWRGFSEFRKGADG